MKINIFNKEIEKFITSLEKPVIAKVLRTLDLLEEFGNKLGLPHSKKIKKDLFELRTHGSLNVRIFYTFNKREVIILHGYIKKSQKIPQREIKTAENRLKRFVKI